MLPRVAALFTFLFASIHCAYASAQSHASILLYHHVSADTPASTSVTKEQFRQHLDWLSKHHTVLPLTDVIDAIQQNKPLPDNTVVITFDDGYDDIYLNAHPILQEYGFSYTVFVNPSLIGKLNTQLTWEQVSAMQKDGVIFANHTSEHNHLLTRNDNESDQAWLGRTMQDVEQAETLLKEKTGKSLRYVAYPYGEYNQLLAETLSAMGYIGFGQQSGAISASSNFSALPRFPAAGIYANLNSLKVKMASLALPVTSTNIVDPEWQVGRTPQIELTLDVTDFNIGQITCYKGGSPLDISRTDNQVSFSLPEALKAGRSRVNCTAPSQSKRGRYYWYSVPFFVPTEKGKWLD